MVEQPNHIHKAVVEDVHDGDTFRATVFLDFFVTIQIRVRVLDLWCPELDQPNGPICQQTLSSAIHGKEVWLKSYKDKMSFERWVCDVWFDGQRLPDMMVGAGCGFYTKRKLEEWLKQHQP